MSGIAFVIFIFFSFVKKSIEIFDPQWEIEYLVVLKENFFKLKLLFENYVGY